MFKGERVFENPKDHEVLARLIRYVTNPKDIILDSFAGSGSTGQAICQLNAELGGERRFVLVEIDPSICQKVTQERLKRAIDGYSYAGEKDEEVTVPGLGGGFRYCKLSKPIFDEGGNINPEVKFADLAAHVFFTETGEPIPKRADGKTPLIGVCNATAYYLLYNGVLGDKRVNGGNILTGKMLAELPAHDGPKVIYGEGCRLGTNRLKRENVVFKQVPYEIKVS